MPTTSVSTRLPRVAMLQTSQVPSDNVPFDQVSSCRDIPAPANSSDKLNPEGDQDPTPRACERSPSLSFQLQVENRLSEVQDQISKSVQDVKSRLADHSNRLKTLAKAVAFIQAEIRNQRSTPVDQIQTDVVRLVRDYVNRLLENQGVRSGQVPRLEDLPPQGGFELLEHLSSSGQIWKNTVPSRGRELTSRRARVWYSKIESSYVEEE